MREIYQYYILSLKHTLKGDDFITLWAPNSLGYTQDVDKAGFYDYKAPDETKKLVLVNRVFNVSEFNTQPRFDYEVYPELVLLNNQETWTALGLEKEYSKLKP